MLNNKLCIFLLYISEIKYFQFVLQKVDKGANKFNIILTLDDVTQIMN